MLNEQIQTLLQTVDFFVIDSCNLFESKEIKTNTDKTLNS